MSGQGIASFVQGFIGGRDTRSRWRREQQDEEWKLNRRERQEVVDGQADEQFERQKTIWGYDDERFDRERETWDEDRAKFARQQDVWGQQDARFANEQRGWGFLEEERDRTRKGWEEEDADQRAAALAYEASKDASAPSQGRGFTTKAPPTPGAPKQDPVVASVGTGAEYAPSLQPPASRGALGGSQGRSLNDALYGRGQGYSDYTEATRGFRSDAPRRDVPEIARPWEEAEERPAPQAAPAGIVGRTPTPTPQVTSTPLGDAKAATEGDPDIPSPKDLPSTAALVDAGTQGRGLPRASAPPMVKERAAKRATGSFLQHYAETGAPMMVEHYLKTGRPDKAAAYQEFVDAQPTKEAMGHWADAAFAASIGDETRFIESLSEAYNTRGYMDDGYEAVAEQSGFTKDERGNITGGRITFRDQRTGNTFVQEFDSKEDLYRAGINLLSPEQVFEKMGESADRAEERRAAIVDAYRRQAGKAPGETQYKMVSEAMEQIAKTPEGMSMTQEQLMQAALGYVSQFDSHGRYIGGTMAPTAGSRPQDVPVW